MENWSLEERYEVYRYNYDMRLNELTKAGVQKKKEVYAPHLEKEKKLFKGLWKEDGLAEESKELPVI